MKEKFIKIYKSWKNDRENFFMGIILGTLATFMGGLLLCMIGFGIYQGYKENPTITVFVIVVVLVFVVSITGSVLLGKHFLVKEET